MPALRRRVTKAPHFDGHHGDVGYNDGCGDDNAGNLEAARTINEVHCNLICLRHGIGEVFIKGENKNDL